MNFTNIKLIVSDMDGTLLNDNHEVSQRFFDQFEALKKKDIHFIAASGRQMQSIQTKLSKIQKDISIIAENGSIITYNNKTEVLLELHQNDIAIAIGLLRQVEQCYPVLCGKNTAYVETNDQEFISKLAEYYTEYTVVEDLTTISQDAFLKIAAYHFESSETYIYPKVKHLSDHLQVVVSGANWVDISHPEANKGYALKKLQEDLGVTREHTVVFGDYNNDLEMLQLADYSFAMANAHPQVKNTARFSTKSNSEQGVEYILDQIISS
ncbi:Cof-type HAD-IIB family hydrolase [Gaetbulibacter aestuarii]